MLAFLFNRNGLLPRILEGFGWLFGLLDLYLKRQRFDTSTWLLVMVLISSLFIWGCDRIRWYRTGTHKQGIAVHFLKARIPTAYVLFLTSFGYLLGLRYPLVILAVPCLMVITSVNLILIYFHLWDKDPLPINYFSSNRYLYEK